MKFLGLLGSLGFCIYIVALIVLTSVNVSRYMFDIDRDREGPKFWKRQLLILLWPLVIITAEGRAVLYFVWNDVNWKEEVE